MKEVNILEMLTEENKKMILLLNDIKTSTNISMIEKSSTLLKMGLVEIIKPQNDTQANFLRDGQVIVKISPKGLKLLDRIL